MKVSNWVPTIARDVAVAFCFRSELGPLTDLVAVPAFALGQSG